MNFCISIDWLSLHCSAWGGQFVQSRCDGSIFGGLFRYDYKVAEYGTRQFKVLTIVSTLTHGNKREPLCEVQSGPHSEILDKDMVLVKFNNRLLYSPYLWDYVRAFLNDHNLTCKGISRVDICADFCSFENNYNPISFIADFMGSHIRHVGRGQGQAYFDHGTKKDDSGNSKYYLRYTGLAFGSNESDFRVYLYNKTFELLTQKDKPYIRDRWYDSGIIEYTYNRNGKRVPKSVWRLEVSLKSGAMSFLADGTPTTITMETLQNDQELETLYFSFINKKFAFVQNREGITNITREPRLQLFDGHAIFEHKVKRDKSCSGRMERIMLKKMWLLSDEYRGGDILEDEGISKSLAVDLARSVDLEEWLKTKSRLWEKPNKK